MDRVLHLVSSDLNYQLISSQPGAVLPPPRETFGNPKGCFWSRNDEGGGCWLVILRSQGCYMTSRTSQRHANEPPGETPPGWPTPRVLIVSPGLHPSTGTDWGFHTGQPRQRRDQETRERIGGDKKGY